MLLQSQGLWSPQTKSLSAVGLLVFSFAIHQVLGTSESTTKNNTTTAPNVKTYQSYNNVLNPLGDAGLKFNGVTNSESVKSDNRQTVQPMISPRYRYKFQPSVDDSYLNALKHSHTIIIKDPRDYVKTWPKITRREHAPSPVYRADSNNTGGVKIKSVAKDSEPAASKVSQSNGPYYIQQSEEISYGLPHVTINEFQPYDTHSSPDKSYGTPPKISYSVPLKSHYGAPKKTYGEPPASVYGEPSISTSYGLPPTSSFGESPASYGVPLTSSYGPSSFSSSTNSAISSYVVPSHQGLGSLTASYSTSYPLPDVFPLTFLPGFDFSWPISLKINAYTLLKIVLKIVVFKMVVKFIAAICLLLFIPKLIPKKDDDDDDGGDDDKSRKFGDPPTLSKKKLWMLSSIVTNSIDHYRNENEKLRRIEEEKEEVNCTSLDCQSTEKLLPTGDTWTDYKQLFKLYLAEEAEVAQKDSAS